MKPRLLALIFLLSVVAEITAQNYCRHFTTAEGLLNNQVRQLIELPNGQIFVSTEGAFSVYDGACFNELSYNLDSLYSLPKFGTHSYMYLGDSILLIKDYYSLYIYDVCKKSFRYDYDSQLQYPSVRDFIVNNVALPQHTDQISPDSAENLFHTISNRVGLPYEERYQTYLCDYQGGVWYGTTSNGILYVSPQAQKARLYIPVPNENIRHIARVSDDELLLAGCDGIYLYNVTEGKVLNSYSYPNLGCVHVSTMRDGTIYLSTLYGLGVYANGKLDFISPRNANGFFHSHMRFALPLADGRLLLCNLMHHLGYYYPSEHRFESLLEKNPTMENYRTMITAIATGKQNEILVCTQNGLFTLDTASDRIRECHYFDDFSQFSCKYNCALRDTQGRIWVGTQNGLLLMQADSVRRFSVTDGLTNSCIKSILEDYRGNIWVGTSYGINRISADTDEILNYGVSDGVPPVEMQERGVCILNDSTLCYASMAGIINISLREPYVKYKESTKVRLVAQDMTNEHVWFRFSNLNYMSPQHTRYRYRLRNTGEAWQYLSGDKGAAEVRYSSLSPGEYTFEVQSSSGSEHWGEPTLVLFSILPPLWLTWWAKTLYAILIMFVIAVAVQVYLRRRKIKLERENDERVNLLFELRDEARHQFAQSVRIEPDKITVNKKEEELVQRMMKAIERNMDNVDYNIDQLAQDVFMSRTDLYRKTQQMLGITPNNFLRSVRMKYAAMLIAETNEPIQKIALRVGFKNPRYFSQGFQQLFGVTPTEYRSGIS